MNRFFSFSLLSLFLLCSFALDGANATIRAIKKFTIPHHPFILVTPEKCGTHLLMKAMEQLVDKETLNLWRNDITTARLLNRIQYAASQNKYVHIHANPTHAIISFLQHHNIKVIFLMRDPRDQAVSMLHYIDDRNWRCKTLNPRGPYGLLNFDDKLLEIITGNRYGVSGVRHAICKKLAWMDLPSDFVYTVHFENLVGEEGGGSRKLQMMEIRNIAKHLNLQYSDRELHLRSQGLFGKRGEKTFRKGQIGEWRETFKQEHVKAFKKNFGRLLIRLGYEKDLNWQLSCNTL